MWAASLALCIGAAVPGPAPARSTEPSLEYAVKANYLYKFTPFIEWPPAAFAAPVGTFNLCVAGRDPFGPLIDQVVRERRVGDHPVSVVRLSTVAKGAPCHMLFLGRSRHQTPQQMLAAVAGQPVLTIADHDLKVSGAMIQFVIVQGRVRFQIQVKDAQANGLTFSSKLLALSVSQKAGWR